jgi:hypothetical protein
MTGLVVLLAILAMPWAFAALMLARVCSLPGTDGPTRLLALATAALPGERREWGRAMSAELAHVEDVGARWRFAAGCAAVAVTPTRGGRVNAATIVAVAGSAAAASYFVGQVPGIAPATLAVLIGLLGGYLGLALLTPPALNAERDARGIAVGAAAVLALGLLGASRVALDGVGVAPYLLLAPPVILVGAAALGARRSLRGGIQTAAWATLLGTLTTFAVGLFEALHWHQTGAGLLLDAEAPYRAATNFGDLVLCLVVLPLWWAPFALIGALAWARRFPTWVHHPS